jgi:hypothetical protein
MLGALLGRLFRRRPATQAIEPALTAELSRIVREQCSQALDEHFRSGFGPHRVPDLEQAAYLLATQDSARYFVDHMRMARNLVDRNALIRFALEQCEIQGLALQFGVYQGASLRLIAEAMTQKIYGFDSFEGLPEDWTHFQRKGRFSMEGRLPALDLDNVRLVKGWFDETLPAFLSTHEGAVRFVHIDSDIYSSAVTVLNHLRPRLVKGTVILFDEYMNYPGWQLHEFKAFQEHVNATGQRYEYLGFASSSQGVAVKLL